MQLARKKKLCHIHTPFTVVWFGDAMRTDAQMHIADGLVMQCVKLHMVWFKCNAQTREIYAACEQSYTHIDTPHPSDCGFIQWSIGGETEGGRAFYPMLCNLGDQSLRGVYFLDNTGQRPQE